MITAQVTPTLRLEWQELDPPQEGVDGVMVVYAVNAPLTRTGMTREGWEKSEPLRKWISTQSSIELHLITQLSEQGISGRLGVAVGHAQRPDGAPPPEAGADEGVPIVTILGEVMRFTKDFRCGGDLERESQNLLDRLIAGHGKTIHDKLIDGIL
jgi:hypothetical protein